METSEILTWRVGVPGPSGHTVTASDWTDVLSRVTDVEAVAETTNPIPNQSGVFLSTTSHGLGFGSQTSTTMGTEQILFTPIFIRDGFTADKMAVYVEGPQAGATLGLAVYGPDWSLIRDFGTVNAETMGWKFSTATNAVVPRGTNWLAVRSNNVANIGIASIYPAFPMFHSDASMQTYGAYARGASSSFPSTFTISGLVQDMPWLGLGVA